MSNLTFLHNLTPLENYVGVVKGFPTTLKSPLLFSSWFSPTKEFKNNVHNKNMIKRTIMN